MADDTEPESLEEQQARSAEYILSIGAARDPKALAEALQRLTGARVVAVRPELRGQDGKPVVVPPEAAWRT